MVKTVEFDILPERVVWYYNKGPTDQRVLKCHSRNILRRRQIVGTEYVVVTNYGRDYWRQDQWGDWKLCKSSSGIVPPVE